MRLLNTRTREFQEFTDKHIGNSRDTPPYVILSHRWIDSEEVSYQEFLIITVGDDLLGASTSLHRRSVIERKKKGSGYRKIISACERALQDGFEWIWIDTCCIDKRSSAEISEVVNSMWRWYENSQVCYAYLHDIDFVTSFYESNWFTRGWTLQELLGPDEVKFFDKRWNYITDKHTASEKISRVTSISSEVIENRNKIFDQSVNTRMRWAANRQTTRIEDLAYSLLGIFKVSMTLLYGEGNNAFVRLQKEIIAQSDDESIFAHNDYDKETSPLASHPRAFVLGDAVLPGLQLNGYRHTQLGKHSFTISNKGIRWRAALVRGVLDMQGTGTVALALNCRFATHDKPLLLRLSTLYESGVGLYRGLNIEHPTLGTNFAANLLVSGPNVDPFQYQDIALCWQRTSMSRAKAKSWRLCRL